MSVVFRCFMRDFCPFWCFCMLFIYNLVCDTEDQNFLNSYCLGFLQMCVCLCPQYFVSINGRAFVPEEWNISQRWHPREELVCLRSNKWREIIGSTSLLWVHLITPKLLDVLPSELVYRWAKTNLLLSRNRFPGIVRWAQGLIWAKKAFCCLSLNASLQQLIQNVALRTWWTPAEYCRRL